MADEEFNPAAFFDAIRKSVHVKAGAIMFGQAQVAYYDALKEGMPEDQAFNMLAHTTEHVVRGVFSAVGPVCDAILKAAAMAEMFGLSNKPSDKKVPE